MGSNQSMPIHHRHVLLDDTARGKDWLCGRGDTTGAIPLDSSKAFPSVSHSSLVALLRIQTTGWVKNLVSIGLKTVCSSSLTVRWLQLTALRHQNQGKTCWTSSLTVESSAKALLGAAWRGEGSEEAHLQFPARAGTVRNTEPDSPQTRSEWQQTRTANCNQGAGHEEQMLGHGRSKVLEPAPRQAVGPPPPEVSKLQGLEQLGLALKLA